MTKSERAELRKALFIIMGDDDSDYCEAIAILARLARCDYPAWRVLKGAKQKLSVDALAPQPNQEFHVKY
jgi:hypothetical protein